ncbi:MAG: tetratricopeptide repeat protein, partial [Myxococcota bacterium]
AGAVAVAGVGVTLAVLRPWQEEEAAAAEVPPSCAPPPGGIAALWGDARREQLRARLEGQTAPHLASAADRIDAAIVAYVDAWEAMRMEACTAARIDGTQSEEEFALRNACLDGRRLDLEVFTTVLLGEEGPVLAGALGAVSQLRAIETCADLGALRSLPPPESDPAAAEELAELRHARTHARILLGAGRYNQALELAEENLANARVLDHKPELARALLLVAESNLQLTRPAAAEPLAREAIEIASPMREHNVEADAAIILLVAAYGQSRFAEARAMVGSANAAVARAGRPERVARVLFHEANLAYLEGDLGKALDKAGAAIDAYKQADGVSALGLGRVTMLRGSIRVGLAGAAQAGAPDPELLTDAHVDFEEARRIYLELIGPLHADQGAIEAADGMAYRLEGDRDRALPLFRKSADLYARLDPNHPNAMAALQHIGSIEDELGNVAAAEDALMQSLAIGSHVYGETNAALYSTTQRTARIAWEDGRWDEAAERYAWGNRIVVALRGEDSLDVATYEYQLAQLAQSQGKPEEALQHCERALALHIRHAGAAHPATRAAEAVVGDAYVELGRCDDGRPHLSKAVEIAAEHSLAPDAVTVQGTVARARCLLSDGDVDGALAKLDHAKGLLAGLADVEIMTGYEASVRAKALRASGDETGAVEQAKAAIDMFERQGAGYAVYADALRKAFPAAVK